VVGHSWTFERRKAATKMLGEQRQAQSQVVLLPSRCWMPMLAGGSGARPRCPAETEHHSYSQPVALCCFGTEENESVREKQGFPAYFYIWEHGVKSNFLPWSEISWKCPDNKILCNFLCISKLSVFTRARAGSWHCAGGPSAAPHPHRQERAPFSCRGFLC